MKLIISASLLTAATVWYYSVHKYGVSLITPTSDTNFALTHLTACDDITAYYHHVQNTVLHVDKLFT
jgi:hypothetical protein